MALKQVAAAAATAMSRLESFLKDGFHNVVGVKGKNGAKG